jgi:UDP-GlcNAc3NAcA epimerase
VTILSVVGARPQFIKLAVIARALAASGGARHVVVHTGQHHDANMSDVFFRELELPAPDHHLGVAGGPHGEMTGRMLERLELVLAREAPDWVLVFGDTNSTLAGALAAAKLGRRVAHVEAGLRSWNRAMPEEVNRVVTDHLSDLLFAPTPAAVRNLAAEGIAGGRVVVTGDVMFDAALHHARHGTVTAGTRTLLEALGEGFLLATVHRAQNTDDAARLRAILDGLADASAERPVVLPLHPRTRQALGGWRPPATLRVTEPVGHPDTLALLRACGGVLTDSGGLQKEAFFFARPCVVLREETEWVELVEGGFARLVGADRAAIAREARAFLGRPLADPPPLYGDGRAGEAIVTALRGR